MMSSVKFSCWSSPQMITTSGRNSSRMLAGPCRKWRTRLSRCPAALAVPPSSPYSRRIGLGPARGIAVALGQAGVLEHAAEDARPCSRPGR